MSVKNKQKRNISNIRLILIMLAFYLALTVVLLVIFFPTALESWHYYSYKYLSAEDIIVISVVLCLSVFIITTLLIFYFMKYRDMKAEENAMLSDPNMETHGDYSNERRYLEKQIAELTSRLTNSEEKWTAINHLILTANKKNFENSDNDSSKRFLSGLGIDLSEIQIDPKMIFVLTPSDQEYMSDYLAVQTACHECRLQAVRGDEEDLKYGNKNMLTYIIEHILSARIVVANISNRNPNVFYEIGIAHMAGKPTILLCRKNMEVPFDLQQKYIVFYSSEIDLSKKLKDEIISILAD